MTGRRRHPERLLLAILVLSGAGAWISGELVKQHDDIWGSAGLETGFFGRVCRATQDAGLDCAGALKTGWAEIDVPFVVPGRGFTFAVRRIAVPAAFLGLAYFVFMGVWFAFVGGPRPFGRRWHRLPVHVGRAGALASLFYLGVMSLGHAPWCVWCCVVHAINFLMIFIIGRVCAAWGIDDSTAVIETFSPTQVARKTLTSREAIRAVGLAMIVIGGLWLYRREHLAFEHSLDRLRPYRTLVASLRDDPDFLLREFYAQPQHQIPPRREEPVTGDLPQLVVFTDFECPACYCNWGTVQEQIVEAFGSRLDVRVRHYPLCNACNEAVETEGHRNACAAACAAEAARVLGGDGAFWRMHNLLFENRKRLGAALYRDLAVRIGLDADRFIAEMDGEPIRDIVTRDIALGRTVGVTQTPTMFLNGRRITELCQGPTFWKTIARQWSSAPGVGEEGFKDSRIEGFKDEG